MALPTIPVPSIRPSMGGQQQDPLAALTSHLQANPGLYWTLAAGLLGGKQALPQALSQIPSAMKLDASRQQQQKQQQAIDAYIQNQQATGAMQPATADLYRAFPDQAAQQALGGAKGTSDITNYQYAKKDGFTGSFQDWLKGPGQARPEYGLNLSYGKDANGNWVALQPSKAGGGLTVAPTPEGVTLQAPGDIAGAKADATVDAKTAGAARAALPAAEQAVTIAKDAIDSLRNDAAGQADQFGNFLGIIPQQMTLAIPGTPKANFRVKLEQATGQAFMQARSMLKGGGQITDYEGRRGEAAYSRMQAAAEQGSRDEFLRALDDFEQAVDAGYEKLQKAAQGGYAKGAAPKSDGWNDLGNGVRIRELP